MCACISFFVCMYYVCLWFCIAFLPSSIAHTLRSRRHTVSRSVYRQVVSFPFSSERPSMQDASRKDRHGSTAIGRARGLSCSSRSRTSCNTFVHC